MTNYYVLKIKTVDEIKLLVFDNIADLYNTIKSNLKCAKLYHVTNYFNPTFNNSVYDYMQFKFSTKQRIKLDLSLFFQNINEI